MKASLIAILIFFSLTAGMQDSIVFFAFKINQSDIIVNFCENRDKPEMKCNGKCHLKKQLDKKQASDSNEASQIKNYQFDLFSILLIDEIQVFECKLNENAYQVYLDYLTADLRDIFHPPQL